MTQAEAVAVEAVEVGNIAKVETLWELDHDEILEHLFVTTDPKTGLRSSGVVYHIDVPTERWIGLAVRTTQALIHAYKYRVMLAEITTTSDRRYPVMALLDESGYVHSLLPVNKTELPTDPPDEDQEGTEHDG